MCASVAFNGLVIDLANRLQFVQVDIVTNPELHTSNNRKAIHRQFIFIASHELVFALLHDARQDQHSYILCLSGMVKNAPVTFG